MYLRIKHIPAEGGCGSLQIVEQKYRGEDFGPTYGREFIATNGVCFSSAQCPSAEAGERYLYVRGVREEYDDDTVPCIYSLQAICQAVREYNAAMKAAGRDENV